MIISNCLFCNKDLIDLIIKSSDQFIFCDCNSNTLYSTQRLYNFISEYNISFTKDIYELLFVYDDYKQSSINLLNHNNRKIIYSNIQDYFLIEEFKLFQSKLASDNYMDFIEKITLLS